MDMITAHEISHLLTGHAVLSGKDGRAIFLRHFHVYGDVNFSETGAVRRWLRPDELSAFRKYLAGRGVKLFSCRAPAEPPELAGKAIAFEVPGLPVEIEGLTFDGGESFE